MPISKSIQVSKTRQVAIWKIEESFEQLLGQLQPNDKDKALLHSFKNDKKQLEWLSGRLAIKHLVHNKGKEYSGLSKDEHGKPFINGLDYEISLTHSFPHVAAILDETIPVGIDLEQPREKVVRIAPKYCNNEELFFCQNDILKLNVIWCAKETLYKVYGKKGLIFKEQIAIKPFEIGNEFLVYGNIIMNDIPRSYKLRCILNDEYIITFNV